MINQFNQKNSVACNLKIRIAFALLLFSFFSANAQPPIWEDGDDVDDETDVPIASVNDFTPYMLLTGVIAGFYLILKEKKQS